MSTTNRLMKNSGEKAKDHGNSDYVDKTLSTTANLVKLLPTGTTLAFQALVPSFTNHGKCYPINRCMSVALIGFCCAICALLSFTDSFTDKKGRPYYGLVLPARWYKHRFYPFNYDHPVRTGGEGRPSGGGDDDATVRSTGDGNGDEGFVTAELKRRALRPRDFMHAILRVFVFLVLAISDAGVQSCLFPVEQPQWKEALVNLPLGVGFIASFFFMIFPSVRTGIGYAPIDANNSTSASDDANAAADDNNNTTTKGPSKPSSSSGADDKRETDVKQLQTGKSSSVVDKVAPSTSCHHQLDLVV